MQYGLFGGWLSSVCQKKGLVGTTKSPKNRLQQGTVKTWPNKNSCCFHWFWIPKSLWVSEESLELLLPTLPKPTTLVDAIGPGQERMHLKRHQWFTAFFGGAIGIRQILFLKTLYNPRHPNTWWVGVWTPNHPLRRLLGVPNTYSPGIWRIWMSRVISAIEPPNI